MGQDAGGSHAGIRQGRVGVEGDAVPIRRRDGLRRVRRASTERLRDAHLGEPRLRRDVPIVQRQSEGRGGQDAHGRSAQPGCDLRGHGDRALRLARSRQELVAAAGQLPGRARRRDHAASTRERDAARHARPVTVDPRSHLADSGVPGGAGRGRASVLDRSGAAVAVTTTRTTSSGGISTSSARTRRPMR